MTGRRVLTRGPDGRKVAHERPVMPDDFIGRDFSWFSVKGRDEASLMVVRKPADWRRLVHATSAWPWRALEVDGSSHYVWMPDELPDNVMAIAVFGPRLRPRDRMRLGQLDDAGDYLVQRWSLERDVPALRNVCTNAERFFCLMRFVVTDVRPVWALQDGAAPEDFTPAMTAPRRTGMAQRLRLRRPRPAQPLPGVHGPL